MGTYISAGAVGTLFSLYWANLGRGNITAHSVGASAAIWGISVLYCLLTDQEKLKIPFVKEQEVAFWPKMLLGAFIVLEIFQSFKKGTSTADHASHYGGMFVGFVTAGYMHANGWKDRPRFVDREGGDVEKGVQERAGVDGKTVDVGAVVKEGVREVRESLTGGGK